MSGQHFCRFKKKERVYRSAAVPSVWDNVKEEMLRHHTLFPSRFSSLGAFIKVAFLCRTRWRHQLIVASPDTLFSSFSFVCVCIIRRETGERQTSHIESQGLDVLCPGRSKQRRGRGDGWTAFLPPRPSHRHNTDQTTTTTTTLKEDEREVNRKRVKGIEIKGRRLYRENKRRWGLSLKKIEGENIKDNKKWRLNATRRWTTDWKLMDVDLGWKLFDTGKKKKKAILLVFALLFHSGYGDGNIGQ